MYLLKPITAASSLVFWTHFIFPGHTKVTATYENDLKSRYTALFNKRWKDHIETGRRGRDTKDLTLHTATLNRKGSFQAGTSLRGGSCWHPIPGSPTTGNGTIGVPESWWGRRSSKEPEKWFEVIMAENYFTFGKKNNIQVQEDQSSK